MKILFSKRTWLMATPIIIALVVSYGIKMLIGYVVSSQMSK